MVSIPQSHRDLLTAPVGMLATNGADGFPQVSAVWFIYDEDGLRISVTTSRQKAKNLRKSPECTFFLLDPNNPNRTLEIRAQAEITPDPDYAFATKIGEKYGANLREYDQPGDSRLVITLQPVKVNTWG